MILTRWADHLEKMARIKRRLYSALAYPAVVVAVSLLVLYAIIIYVIPIFSDIYANLGAELPSLTQSVIDVSVTLASNVHWLLVAMFSLTVLVSLARRLNPIKQLMDRMLLALPILGSVLSKLAFARYCRTLSLLHGSGTTLMPALSLASATLGNSWLLCKVAQAHPQIEAGQSLAVALTSSTVVPRVIIRLIATGEKTGKLSYMLEKGADYYEAEADTTLSTLVSVAEPLIVVLLGGLVGFILMVLYLPLFDLVGQVGP